MRHRRDGTRENGPHRCENRPFAALAALQVEEAGLAGAAVALDHVGQT